MHQSHNLDRYLCSVIAYVPRADERAAARLVSLAAAMRDVQFVLVTDAAGHTSDQIDDNSAALANLTHVQLDVALGKGAALRVGMNATESKFVAFMEADADIDPATIRKFFGRLAADENIDGVIANRFPRGVFSTAPTPRRIASLLLNQFGRVIFGLSTADPQGCLKAFRRRAITPLFEDLRLYNRGFDIELLFQARRNGLQLRDEPIRWRPGRRSWPLLSTGTQVVATLFFLRLLYSPLSKLQLVDLLGRKYFLPVKRRYSIMLFCWRDPLNPLAGGGELYLQEQARQWVADGHNVTWFAQRFRGSTARQTIDGIEVVRAGKFPWVFILGGLWYIFRSRKNYDFIVDCMNGIPFFTPLFSTKPKVCLVYHIHAHHFLSELPPLIGHVAAFVETRLVPLIYRRTSFMTISESTKSEMQALHMSRLPIEIVYSGVSGELQPGNKAEVPTVLYLGRIKAYKRVRKLIDAFSIAKRSIPEAQLLIAGSGDDEDSLKAYAATAGCGGIRFLGRVSESEKKDLMQKAWVFGMPSSIEGWGIVVIEANACGTPAVAYDVRGLRDCIRNGETGFLVDTDEEYAHRLMELFTDVELRNRMSDAARDWSHHFSWRATSQRTLDRIRAAQPWRAVFEPDTAESSMLRLVVPQSPHESERVLVGPK
jgi:glycosyltransferase involved in cell wall biosynthesis